MRLGDLLVAARLVTPEQVTEALANCFVSDDFGRQWVPPYQPAQSLERPHGEPGGLSNTQHR